MAAWRDENKKHGKTIFAKVIDTLKHVPEGLPELKALGRTLNRRRDDILAYFDHPGTSNGLTEAINGRIEHLRGIVYRQHSGMGRAVLADTALAAVLDTCDGELPLGVIQTAVAQILEFDADKLQTEQLPTLRKLVQEGLLLPA